MAGRPPVPVERIVMMALRIADEQGADALSMRSLAQALDSGTATLYRAFREPGGARVTHFGYTVSVTDLGIAGKAFIVTGGTDGLGFATARALVEEGANVLVTGRTEAKWAAAQQALGERSAFVAGDNADATLPARLRQAVLDRWGRLDGLLVSVGGPPVGKVLSTDDAISARRVRDPPRHDGITGTSTTSEGSPVNHPG